MCDMMDMAIFENKKENRIIKKIIISPYYNGDIVCANKINEIIDYLNKNEKEDENIMIEEEYNWVNRESKTIDVKDVISEMIPRFLIILIIVLLGISLLQMFF